MKVSRISQFHKTYNFTPKNNQLVQEKTQTDIFFRGKSYPSGYYTDEEIEYAKKYLGKEDWETDLRKEHMSILGSRMNALKYIFTTAPEKETEKIIREIRKLMIDLNNEKLAEMKKQKDEIISKAKEEIRNSEIKQKLLSKFVNKIQENERNPEILVPTAILLTGSTKEKREEIINWLKLQTNTKNLSFILPTDEDDALYRLETEIEYAKEHYNNSKQRTVLYIDNFENILNSTTVSAQTIGNMKAMMFELSEDKAPITIIFSADNTQNIDPAFLKNNRRIPLKLNFDDLMLGKKIDWKNDLDPEYHSMTDDELERVKYYTSIEVEKLIEEKKYKEVVILKEKMALICEMQGKERDAFLLRADIENYLKKIN